jgi:hypothetical protein
VTAGFIAVSAAFVAVYGISAYAIWTFAWNRAKATDARFTEMLDRVTNPQAVEAAAFARAHNIDIPKPDTDAEDDAIYGRPVVEEFITIPQGDNE